MGLAFRMVVTSKQEESSNLLPASESFHKVFIALFVEYLLCFLLSHNLHLHMLKTCGLEKQLLLFHVLDLNPTFANQDTPPPPTIRPRNSCICPYLSRRRRSTHFFSSAGGVNACAGVLIVFINRVSSIGGGGGGGGEKGLRLPHVLM